MNEKEVLVTVPIFPPALHYRVRIDYGLILLPMSTQNVSVIGAHSVIERKGSFTRGGGVAREERGGENPCEKQN